MSLNLKILLSGVFALLLFSAKAFELDKSWVVVCAQNAEKEEKNAAKEIVKYVKLISGLSLPIREKAFPGEKAILVKGDRKNYDIDEWVAKGSSKGIRIGGKLPNGVIYGAYTFIEEGLGCCFLTWDCEYIPKKKKIILKDKFDYSGKPAFKGRNIYVSAAASRNEARYHAAKRKLNIFYMDGYSFHSNRMIANYGCHTYHLYTATFPEGKEEYFSKDARGKLHNYKAGLGQLCFTYPGTRDLVVKKMAEIIKADREKDKKRFPGVAHATVLDVSANDSMDKCECPGCIALAKKNDNRYSATVLDFTNALAEKITKIYPDVYVQAFGYQFAQDAPLRMKAHKNVQIQLALLGGDFTSSSVAWRKDSLRSLLHPNNKRTLQCIKEWVATGARIKIWDYWKLWGQVALFPYTAVGTVADSLRIYHQLGIKDFFVEHEFGGKTYHWGNFAELVNYLGARFLIDPTLDEKKETAKFMRLYYGPAHKEMTELLNFLLRSMEQEKKDIGFQGIASAYLNPAFFAQAEKIFARAEKAAGNDKVILDRIGNERIAFDSAMLALDGRIQMKIDRAKILKRLIANETRAIKHFLSPAMFKKVEKDMMARYTYMNVRYPLPKELASRSGWDFPWFKIRKKYTLHLVDDPEALGGKALKYTGYFGKITKINPKLHARPLSFGLYDRIGRTHLLTRVLSGKRKPQDEKYHLYHMGRTRLAKKTMLWVHWTWQANMDAADDVYSDAMPDAEYDIYISLKVEGPSYVPGSKKQDAIYIDRVIFLK